MSIERLSNLVRCTLPQKQCSVELSHTDFEDNGHAGGFARYTAHVTFCPEGALPPHVLIRGNRCNPPRPELGTDTAAWRWQALVWLWPGYKHDIDCNRDGDVFWGDYFMSSRPTSPSRISRWYLKDIVREALPLLLKASLKV